MNYNIIEKTPFKTIVFDFDGTLAQLNIDFSNMHRCVIDLIAGFDVNPGGLENLFVLEMIEAGRKLIALSHPGQETVFLKNAYELIRNIEIEGAKRGKLFDGTEEMMNELKTHNIKIGVVTRNCIDAVKILCPRIEDFCGAVITREATRKVKPNPEQLKIALKELDADPAHTAMVGDHPMDISTGKDVGTYTIGVLTGYADENLLRKAGADIILDNATKVTELISRQGSED